MIDWMMHLPVLPVVIPLLTGAMLLLLPESRRRTRITMALSSAVLQLAVAIGLLYLTTDYATDVWTHGIGVYSIGAWPAPFGIVLVVDRLSALMLVLTAMLAVPSLVYALARWDRVGVNYHPLLQFLMLGLNGAFLTGDLFNLFVFFEVLLAASYGLLLHGSGPARVKASVHYIVVNLVASFLFLIGVATLYGVTGTLNMADLGARWPALDGHDRALFEIAAAILGIAFLVKAGSWPLNFWLPNAYTSAGAPVAAIFCIMTKVGVYAIVRLGSVLVETGAPTPFAGPWLFYGGLATMIFGIVGMLGSQHLGRAVSYAVIVSSGTLLAALGMGVRSLTAPALFYLISSVLATAAFFILTGLTDRTRTRTIETHEDAPLPAISYDAFGEESLSDPLYSDEEVGVAIPAAMAFMGLAFVCCVLLVTGLPPLSGFLAKFSLVTAVLAGAEGAYVPVPAWAMVIALLATGLAGIIALTRIGMRLFWTVTERHTPRLRLIEAGPVAFLVLACIVLTFAAEPVMTYLESAAATLHDSQGYIQTVLSSRPPVAGGAP